MTVVYLDRVLLLNLLVDYLLLLTTAQLAGIPLRRGRLALCAAVGALYAGAVFLPGLSWLSHPLCRTAGGAAMALAAWRREAHPWRLTALFFLLAGGLGGLVLALGLASGSVAAYVGRLYRAECFNNNGHAPTCTLYRENRKQSALGCRKFSFDCRR